MALIPNSLARTLTRDAVVLDLGDLAAQAERLTTQSTAHAAAILAAAAVERERLLSGAKAAGYAAGLKEGRAEGHEAGRAQGCEEAATAARAQYAHLSAAWSAALETFNQDRDSMLAAAREDLLRLAVRFAERIVKRIILFDDKVVSRNLQAILPLVMRDTRCAIRIHPSDVPSVRKVLPDVASGVAAPTSHVQITPSDSLPPGSCIIETPKGGTIDASVLTQLDRLVEALLPGSSVRAAATAESRTPQSAHVGTFGPTSTRSNVIHGSAGEGNEAESVTAPDVVDDRNSGHAGETNT